MGITITYIGFAIVVIGIFIYLYALRKVRVLNAKLNDRALAMKLVRKYRLVSKIFRFGGVAIALIGLAIAYGE